MYQIIKRDGRLAVYDGDKIKSAMSNSYRATYGKDSDSNFIALCNNTEDYIKSKVEENAEENKLLSVEDIQDMVENSLMDSSFKPVARNYITYRNYRTNERLKNTELLKGIEGKLKAISIDNQNANIDERSFGGRTGEATGLITKYEALNYGMSPKSRENHLSNYIYQHDLDSYYVGMPNCTVRDTMFVTSRGIRSFFDFNDGDETVVLTHLGNYKRAKIKKYGVSDINMIGLSSDSHPECTRYVYFTPDHRWILSDGSVTTDLKVGDVLYPAPDNQFLSHYDGEYEEELYRVTSIDRNYTRKETWCLEVEDDHSFVIACGEDCFIVTGNCLSVPFDHLLARGFTTRQSDVRPANSVGTAFQLLAVIFQIQSLSQFGGVSATHLDATMVPYVRKSFYKHYKRGLKYAERVSDIDREKFDRIVKSYGVINLGIDSPEYKVYPSAYEYAYNLTVDEIKQAAEGMFHNLNTLQSRSGN